MKKTHHRALILFGCFCLSLLLSLGKLFFQPSAAFANTPPSFSSSRFAQANVSQQLTPQQGQQRYEAGEFAEAASLWETAEQTFRAQGDVLNQASVLSNLALAYQQMGDIARSDRAIAQSHTLLKNLVPNTDTANVLAQVWNTQGNLFLLRSHPTQALDAFEKATAYYTQANDANGMLRSQLNQVQALQALGFYRRALLNLTDLTPSLKERPDSLTKVTGLQMLGDLQRITGDLEASKATLEVGLATARLLEAGALEAGALETEDHGMAALLLSLGHTVDAQEDVKNALTYYQAAATSAKTIHQRLRAQLSQLSLLRGMGDRYQTDRLAANIQASLATLPVDRVTLNVRLALARQQLDLVERDLQAVQTIAPKLAQDLAIAAQQAKTISDTRAESYALGYLGELYRHQAQTSEAKVFWEQALTLAQSLPDLAYQWQWQLGQLAQAQGNTSLAITQYNNAVDNLQLLRGNLIAIDPDLRFNFTEKVEPVYRGLVDLLLTNAADSATDPEDSQLQLLKARQAVESLQLAEVENFFQEPCIAISQQIDQVIENTVSPTAVIYPIILPDRLEIILKLPQQPLQQFTTPVSQTELEKLLSELQRDLRLPFTIQAVKSESARLYDWLISPIKSELDNSQIDTLVFVLDGFLRSIPMAVLYDGQQYLVENYSIALTPGLQLVDPQPLGRQELTALVAGLSESRHGFSALPSVKEEVTQVQQSTNSQVLLNEFFTESNLATAINNTPYPLVHLATHGKFSDDPNDTFVLAWDKPIQVNELNRLLRQSEQSRQGAIELLILSACETAAGDKRAALGLAGVAVQAGARSTLASLWVLEDKAGAVFSDYFYQALQNPNLSKAQAVREAQLKLLGRAQSANGPYQHPLYWAPYVLLGNWL